MKALVAALAGALLAASAVVVDVAVDRPLDGGRPVAQAAPAGDDEVIAFVVRGVGNGHGRGLSQWGSYGRAIDGQSWQEILAAYYGGTDSGVRNEDHLRVRLTGWDGVSTVGVISRGGTARWNGSSTNYTSLYAVETSANRFTVYGLGSQAACPGGADLAVPTATLRYGDRGAAVRDMQLVLSHLGYDTGPADGIFGERTETGVRSFQSAHAPPADGVWSAQEASAAQSLLDTDGGVGWVTLGTNLAGPITFTTTANQSTAAPGDVLGVCTSSGSVKHYRGRIELASTSDGNRVVNDLDVENYLRGVVPKESPASWGDAAGGAGMNALRAQSVAARSYGVSQQRYAYAGTCDTPSCQVYGGSATRLSPSNPSYVKVEHPNTDRAIRDTAGVVRVRDGAIVSTEFSASNGPRTAGGNFPAVDDPWDDQPGNPNHRWTRVIDADRINAKYGLASANGVMTQRDGDSFFEGIWANEVRLGNGSTRSAWSFRNDWGLPAPGFDLVPIRRTMTNALDFAFIGDSVGESVAGSSTSAFRVLTEGVFESARWDAVSSRRTQGGSIPDGVGAARSVPVGTDLVVVELGYNDTPSTMPGRIDAVMAQLRARDVGMVVWLTVSERRALYTETNAAIRAAADRWSELVVLDWDGESDHTAADRWYSDGVHLTSTGRSEFSLWLRDRIVDIVAGGYTPPRPIMPGRPLRVPVLGVGSVPESGVAGVAMNITVARPSAAGYVRVWPCGTDEPGTSSVNFLAAGAIEPNAVVVPVDETGEVCVSSLVASDVIVDVTGWFDTGVSTAAGRLVDTRDTGGRLASGGTLRVPVLGRAGVPDEGVAGVALNVTATRTAAGGYLRVWPCGTDEPGTSSVNYLAAGAIEPNAVIVPVDETGEICVSSLVASDVIVDVTGWFDDGVAAAAGRLVDTRATGGRLPAGATMRVPVLDAAGVPAIGVAGVALNVTAVNPSAAGYLSVWPCNASEPETSAVNYQRTGAVEPNAVVVPVDESGEVCISSLAATDVVVDVTAWFDGGLQPSSGARIVDTRSGIGPVPPR